MKECLGLHSQNVADWTKLVYFQRIKKEQFPCAPCMIVTGSDIFDKYQNSKPYRPVHTFPYPCQYSIFCFARARFFICTCNIFALHVQHLCVAHATSAGCTCRAPRRGKTINHSAVSTFAGRSVCMYVCLYVRMFTLCR